MKASVIPRTGFCECLAGANDLPARGFEEWVFYRAMLFQSLEKWWGKGGRRDKPHEGVDLTLYRARGGRTGRLDAATQVPAMYGGRIIRIIEDHIGKSAFVSHEIHDEKGNQLYSVYGHIEPVEGIGEAVQIPEGQIIGTIAGKGRNEKVGMLPHVHLSVAWVPGNLPPRRLEWGIMNDPSMVRLVDPLDVMQCRYRILDVDVSLDEAGLR